MLAIAYIFVENELDMSETLSVVVERYEFEDINPGDSIQITTGFGDDAYRYSFVAKEVAKKLIGVFTETPPDGVVSETAIVILNGCGNWTTRKQNPVQDQEKAFTPYWDGLIVGSFMVIADPETGERLVFDKPGQEISEINITKAYS